jgi:hypothetical protein
MLAGRPIADWRVGGNTTPGTYEIQVTAAKDGKRAMASTSFAVVE